VVSVGVASSGARDSSIDTLRFAALLGGVAIHAVVPYMRAPAPELIWPIRDPAQTSVADFIFWWGRCAQSQLLFMVAGIVSAQALARRGPRGFVTARLLRLGGPLVAGVVFILPLVAAVAAWGWMESGRVSWDEVRAWRFVDPELQQNVLGPGHLWFLEDLLILSLLYGLWAACGPDTRRWQTRPWLIASSCVLGGLGILLVRPEVVFAVSNSFAPNLPRILYNATFFAAGTFANRNALPFGRATGWLFLAAAGGAATITMSLAPHPTANVDRVTLAFAGVMTGWLSVLGCVGITGTSRRGLSAPAAPLTQYAYPIYVIHLPIVCAVQVLLYPWRWHPLAAIALSFFAGVSVSWLIVELAIRARASAVMWAQRARVIPVERWALAVVTMGVAVRLLQYGRNPDVWHDEAALLVNVIERGYRQLLAPLTFYEAAPPLFLWAERWLALHVSDSQWVMRLLPLAASCATLGLMWPVARNLQPVVAPVTLLLVAASAKLVDHSVEAKPYTLDVFLAALAVWLFVQSKTWRASRRCAAFAILAPFAIWASYPAIFVIAGATCALAVAALRERQRPWLTLGLLIGSQAVSLVVLYAVAVRYQRSPEILTQWAWAFPTAHHPITIAAWLVRSTIGVADYCFRPFGGVLLIPIAFGIFSLVRRGEHAFVALLLTPVAFAAAAGLAWQYPFTGSRTMVLAQPGLAILGAEGIGDLLLRIGERAVLLRFALVAACLFPPIVLTTRDVLLTPTRPQTAAAAQTVLTARSPDEQVAVSNWEYRYYLRGIRSAVVPLDERPVPLGSSRFWCIVHGDSAADRRLHAAATLGEPFTIAGVVDLRGVSVIEVRRSP
jgi:peptidoglycan/LPS O-acetylase OafA/YrhL